MRALRELVLDRVPRKTSWGAEWRGGAIRFARARQWASGRVEVRGWDVSPTDLDEFCLDHGLDREGVRAVSWDLVHRATAETDSLDGETWIARQEARLREAGLADGLAWGECVDGVAYLVRLPQVVDWVRALPVSAQGMRNLLPAPVVLADLLREHPEWPTTEGVLLVLSDRWTLVMRFEDRMLRSVHRFPWGTLDTRTDAEQRARAEALIRDLGESAWVWLWDPDGLPEGALRLWESLGAVASPLRPEISGDDGLDLASVMARRGLNEYAESGIPLDPSRVLVRAQDRLVHLRRVRKATMWAALPLALLLAVLGRIAENAPAAVPSDEVARLEWFVAHPALSEALARHVSDWDSSHPLRTWSVSRTDTGVVHEVEARFRDQATFEAWNAEHPSWSPRRLRVAADGLVSVVLEAHERP